MNFKYNLQDTLKGGIFGLLIADALGVPYEFHTADEIPPQTLIDMIPPKNFQRSHSSVPYGTWSDDGAQALCLLDSLLENEKFDLISFADKLICWWENGYRAVDGYVFDVGIQTNKALTAYMSGIPAQKCGITNPQGKGNGALMRVLPLALWHKGSNEQLIKDSHTQCLITHGAIINQVCCAFYCIVVRGLLLNKTPNIAINEAEKILTLFYQSDKYTWDEYLYSLEQILYHKPWDGNGTGFVVDTLVSAFMIMERAESYQDAVRQAIALGNDTDTTACVVGGLAGIYWGYSNIPLKWIDMLRSKETVTNAVERLVNWRSIKISKIERRDKICY